MSGSPNRRRDPPAPPLRGSRIGAADPRGVSALVEPPSLSLKGGGENARPEAVTIADAFLAAASKLRSTGVETPELDARVLLCHAAGISHEHYVSERDDALTEEKAARFGTFIERRLAGEPVSRIVGSREFYGRTFHIDASTLDPRPDTETLIEASLAVAQEKGWRDRPIRILDLGTGSGAILVTLLAELPLASGIGIDMSLPALDIARRNAEALGVGERAAFAASDWFAAIRGRFDLIVANPPYLAAEEIDALSAEVRRYDPHPALDGGADGLDAYRRIVPYIGASLLPVGAFLAEIGYDQAQSVFDLLRRVGLRVEEGKCLWRDLAGHPRVVTAHAKL